SNYGHYDNPDVDRLVDRAVASAANRDQARRAWRAAVETPNRDAPGIFLYSTSNVAALHNRVVDVTIRPDSWLALLRTWRSPADRLTDRDRVERYVAAWLVRRLVASIAIVFAVVTISFFVVRLAHGTP